MAAVRQLLHSDPELADRLLDELMSRNEIIVGDIRRLVYALRPPALDELGLVGAVRDHLISAEKTGTGATHLRVTVEAPAGGLHPLPAAVEVNAFRIALEAATNVVRHAQADHCTVRFDIEGGEDTSDPGVLRVEIVDDGSGMPNGFRAGVGLTSMRERAEEIGGTLAVEPAAERGTRIIARLPLEGGGSREE
jgi:signal transduction histidine kinase